eukprot:870893-Pyramimonas_sp.AAC.1
MFQIERNARAVTSIFILAKLLAGWARKCLPLTERREEREVLPAALCALYDHPPNISPKLRLATLDNPRVE